MMSITEEEEEPGQCNVFDVTISCCDYCVEETEILEWLGFYVEVFGKLSENVHRKEEFQTPKPTGNGTYSVKMRLNRPIPQFLLMYVKKV